MYRVQWERAENSRTGRKECTHIDMMIGVVHHIAKRGNPIKVRLFSGLRCGKYHEITGRGDGAEIESR